MSIDILAAAHFLTPDCWDCTNSVAFVAKSQICELCCRTSNLGCNCIVQKHTNLSIVVVNIKRTTSSLNQCVTNAAIHLYRVQKNYRQKENSKAGCQCSVRRAARTTNQSFAIRKAWTAQEDQRLLQLTQKYGRHWMVVSLLLGSRNGKQCRERWYNNLRPNSMLRITLQ